MDRCCRSCGEAKPLSEFHWHNRRSGAGFLDVSCRPCRNAADLARIQERRELVNRIKLESGCTDCGYDAHPAALEFDHLPGFTKVKSVATLVTSGTVAAILAEIAKCEVVCANCHRVRTATRGWARPAGERRRGRRGHRDQMELSNS